MKGRWKDNSIHFVSLDECRVEIAKRHAEQDERGFSRDAYRVVEYVTTSVVHEGDF